MRHWGPLGVKFKLFVYGIRSHWIRLQTVRVCLLENGEFCFLSCLARLSERHPGNSGPTMAHLRYFLQEVTGRGRCSESEWPMVFLYEPSGRKEAARPEPKPMCMCRRERKGREAYGHSPCPGKSGGREHDQVPHSTPHKG